MSGRVRQTGCGFRVIGSRALLGSLVSLLALGCADVQKDYPQFGKKWDWWKYPAKKQATSEPADHAKSGATKHAGDEADANRPDEALGENTPTDPRPDDAPPTLSDGEIEPSTSAAPLPPPGTEPSGEARPMVSLEDHRSVVWSEARQLRDLDQFPPERKQQVLDHARASLPAWYKPMPMTRPDPEKDDWVTMVIWDFMPDEEFDRAAEGWRKIAGQEGVPYPDIPTRRDLPKLIRQIREKQKANIVRPAMKPATSPSGGDG